MKIKNVIKVMNFHSLLRVNSAIRKAEKYVKCETELTNMIDNIVNNKNLLLDKKSLKPKTNKPTLNIYIGNDFGFCGNINTDVKDFFRQDNDGQKIIIGKKLSNLTDNVILYMTKEEFYSSFKQIDQIVNKSIHNLEHSEINIIYNHYYNINKQETIKKKLFPIDFSVTNEKRYNEDFVVESDINVLLANLISLYVGYEIRMSEISSWASENIMRQQITKESLRKIEELEDEQLKINRKLRKSKDFEKIIENFTKISSWEGED